MYLKKRIMIILVIAAILIAVLAAIGTFNEIKPETLDFLYFVLVSGLIGLFLGLSLRYILRHERSEMLRRQKIEAKDERNIAIRDRAGYKTLRYSAGMMIVAYIVREWCAVEYDYTQITMTIMFISLLIFYAHTHYYRKRL